MALYKAELLSQLIRVPRARPRPNRSYTPPHRVADELLESVLAHQSVLLCGVPGSGKSTTVDLLSDRLKTLTPLWLVVRWRPGQSADQVLEQVVEAGGFTALSGWGELVTRLRCSPVLAGLLLVVEEFSQTGLEPVSQLAAQLEEVGAPISLLATMACALGSLEAGQEAELRQTFRRLKPISLPGPPGAFESLLTDGYFERREWDHWSTLEADADLAYQLACLTRLKVYDSDELARIVVENGYPLHPTVTFLLPRLAERLNADPFEPFTNERRGGFGYFLNNFRVGQPSGRLSLYLLDQLYGHFEARLPTRVLACVEAVERSARDLPLASRLARTLALLQLVNHDRLMASSGIVLWALHLNRKETASAQATLDALVERGLIGQVEQRLELDFEPPGQSLSACVRELRRRLPERVDSFALLQEAAPPRRIFLSAHNQRHHTDRYVDVVYARPEELERHDGIEARLSRYQLGRRPYAGDFLLVYLIAQRREELERIDQLYDQGRFRQDRLILALPMRSYNFAAESNRLAALERLLEGHPPYSDPTTRAHQQALEAHGAARAKLDESLRLYLSPEYLEFRHQNEVKRLLDGGTFLDYLHELLEQQIGQPPVVPHPQFASLIDSIRNQTRRRKALDYLLATRGPLLLYKNGRPFHLALHRGLIETGLVEACAQGATRSSYLPAGMPTSRLGRLFRDLRSRFLEQPRLELSFASLVDELLRPPHSLAPATIELVVAALLWSFEGRLQLWGNRPNLFTDSAMLAAAVAAPTGHRLVYERWSPSLETFLTGLTEQLGLPVEASEQRLVRELLSWYRGLSEAAVAIGRDKTNEAEWLVDLLEHPVEDPAEFLSQALPRALGLPLEDPETLLVYLAETQRTLEDAVERTRRELNSKLRELFASTGADLEHPWPALVARWCARLPRESADSPMADLGHLLATYSATTTDEDETLEDLLYELDYGPVDRWRQNYTDEVLARVREVKSVLEHAPFHGLYPIEDGQQRQAARRLIAWLARQSGLGPEAFKERSLSL